MSWLNCQVTTELMEKLRKCLVGLYN